MGDHFVLLVDRLLTESTLEAALQHRNSLQLSSSRGEDMSTGFSSHTMDIDINSSPADLVQCKICHEEDEDSNMDIPCSCLGSLKYAHHECVQKWCNEKGDNICEICCQQYKPCYIAPPPLLHYGGTPMNLRGFRGHWEISREDLSNPEFLAMVSRGPNSYIDEDPDEYSEHASQSLICCRSVAIIFTVLLIFRHALPIIISVSGDDSMPFFEVIMLSIGIVMPIYIMVKAYMAIRHRRRHHQDVRSLDNATTNEPPMQQPLPQLVHIR